jgi:hypothetical protein
MNTLEGLRDICLVVGASILIDPNNIQKETKLVYEEYIKNTGLKKTLSETFEDDSLFDYINSDHFKTTGNIYNAVINIGEGGVFQLGFVQMYDNYDFREKYLELFMTANNIKEIEEVANNETIRDKFITYCYEICSTKYKEETLRLGIEEFGKRIDNSMTNFILNLQDNIYEDKIKGIKLQDNEIEELIEYNFKDYTESDYLFLYNDIRNDTETIYSEYITTFCEDDLLNNLDKEHYNTLFEINEEFKKRVLDIIVEKKEKEC